MASLLHGALITATDLPEALGLRMERLNRFLIGRTAGEKYATVFHCLLHADGRMHYINAAHCPPMLVNTAGGRVDLDATGTPGGLRDGAGFGVAEWRLGPGEQTSI